MEIMVAFQCSGAVLCKHGSTEGEMRETAVKGKMVIRKKGEYGNREELDKASSPTLPYVSQARACVCPQTAI